MPNRNDRGEFAGDYARDTHRDGLSDDYARDGGWSGGGRADDYAREPLSPERPEEPVPPDESIRETDEG